MKIRLVENKRKIEIPRHFRRTLGNPPRKLKIFVERLLQIIFQLT